MDRTASPAQNPSPACRRTDRRTFLAWMTLGSLTAVLVLAFGQLARYFSFAPVAEIPAAIPVGKPADYASGARVYVAAARAYVGRDDRGLYAMDAVCTHLGCLVEGRADGGFACPCHGSRFGAGGEVQEGPASEPLHYLALQLNQDGQVVIDRARQMAPATRLVTPS